MELEQAGSRVRVQKPAQLKKAKSVKQNLDQITPKGKSFKLDAACQTLDIVSISNLSME